jgi:hypothetical protein
LMMSTKSRFKALEEIEIPNLKLVKAWIRLDKKNSVSDKANGISRVPSGLPGLAWGYPSYLEALSAKSKPKSGWQPNEEVFGRGQLKGTRSSKVIGYGRVSRSPIRRRNG